MLFLALKNLNKYNIIDVAKTDYSNLEFNVSKANNINKQIDKAIIDGLTSDKIDFVIGYVLGKRLTISCDKNITDMVWNNTDLLSSLINKELKNLIYWLNEYIEINDVYTVMNSATNSLIMRLTNDTESNLLNEKERKLADYLSVIL